MPQQAQTTEANLAVQGAPGEITVPDFWARLCTGFHELRQRAHAAGLEQRWRDLARADPDAPDLLQRWRDLDRDVAELDACQRFLGVRHGGGLTSPGDGWNDWGDRDEPGKRFGCPRGRCNRIKVQYLLPPECPLFGGLMTSLGPREDGSPA